MDAQGRVKHPQCVWMQHGELYPPRARKMLCQHSGMPLHAAHGKREDAIGA